MSKSAVTLTFSHFELWSRHGHWHLRRFTTYRIMTELFCPRNGFNIAQLITYVMPLHIVHKSLRCQTHTPCHSIIHIWVPKMSTCRRYIILELCPYHSTLCLYIRSFSKADYICTFVLKGRSAFRSETNLHRRPETYIKREHWLHSNCGKLLCGHDGICRMLNKHVTLNIREIWWKAFDIRQSFRAQHSSR
jgi:hypothetical protein